MNSKSLKEPQLNYSSKVNVSSDNTDNVKQSESISESANTNTSKRDDIVTVWTLQPSIDSSQVISEHSNNNYTVILN